MYMIYSINNIDTRCWLYIQVTSGGSLPNLVKCKINVPVQFNFLENLYEKWRIWHLRS